MTTVLTIIFFIGLAYYFFLVTPFGVAWIITEMKDDNKPCCYSLVIMFLSILPMLFIGSYLGYIK